MAELRAWLRLCIGGVTVASVLLLSRESHAQLLHWDASAQAGVNKRFIADRGFGPVGQLSAHIALLPLVRVGGYFGHEMSPVEYDDPWRQITFGGLRAKGMLPWVRGAARAWVFAGFGYARTYAPSYRRQIPFEPQLIQGAAGGFFDVPFGLGASYTFFKPWALCAELGGRAGFGHTGSVYGSQHRLAIVFPPNSREWRKDGLDVLGLGLTVGILADF